jgi:hypothetical protein
MICYVGGTGGDFLKTLCLQQLNSDVLVECDITDTGLVLHNRRYFRDICVDYYNNNTVSHNLNLSQVDPVENSHYYFDWFPNLVEKFYYIDFPESATVGIIDVYVTKRHQHNLMHFVEAHKQTLPDWAQQRITEHNAYQFFSAMWVKQLRKWKAMNNMQAINLADFFNRQNLINIVQQLTQQPVKNFDKFDYTFTRWTEKNISLKKLVC